FRKDRSWLSASRNDGNHSSRSRVHDDTQVIHCVSANCRTGGLAGSPCSRLYRILNNRRHEPTLLHSVNSVATVVTPIDRRRRVPWPRGIGIWETVLLTRTANRRA